MKLGKFLKVHGNINRIIEMTEGGVGKHGISGTFRDEGIELTPESVQGITDSLDELGRKALPKSRSRSAIRAAKIMKGDK